MRIDLKAASRAGQTAALSALCSACLLNPLAANAGSLDDAILEVSQTSYPIIKALDPKVLGPFSEKVGKLILDIKPEKLGKSLELGIDVFNSVPDTTVNGFKGMVKEAFSELKTDTCTLVPLPSQAVAFKFQAVATERVEESKLKAFNDKWGPTLGALSKTEDAICLPPPETLDKLSLAQAEIGRSFGAVEAQRFGTYTTPVLKSSITLSKILPLVDDAKKLAPTALPKEKAAFQLAGKKIESAAKTEAMRVRTEALKAKAAAIAEAKAAGQVYKAPVEKAVPNVNQEELAAAREAAAKEAAAKKEAQIKEVAARKQAAKEAEEARIAALKAKSAAIKAGTV